LQEGQNINKSLLVLSSVVNALSDGKPNARVPYRDSKLTRILQDSLGGSAMTAIIICVSPCQAHHSETLSTLRFGARARAIEIKMQSNKTPKPVDALIQQDPSSYDAAPHRAHISPVKFALTWFFISLIQGLGISIILGLHSIPPGKLSP
jgi:kinesin family protein 5